MKVNIILPEFGLTGGTMVALRYAQAFSNYGWDVMCYAPRLPYFKPNKTKDVLHIIHRLVSNYDIKIAIKTCGEFKYAEPLKITNRSVRDADIVIATAWATAYDVVKLSHTKGKKVYFIQDYEIWQNEKLGKRSYSLPLKHITIARWLDDVLVDEIGCDHCPIVYNGVDLKTFFPDNTKRDSEKIACLMMHHYLPKKGIDIGLRVIKKLHKQYPDVTFRMFGKNEFVNKPSYIQYYQDPSISTLVKLYQESDIFIFPPLTEGWGLTAIEAMACGCAVVGSNVGCLSEIGRDKWNAMICKPGDEDELFNGMRMAIEDHSLRKAISDHAIETAKELSWDVSYNKFIKCIIDIKNNT